MIYKNARAHYATGRRSRAIRITAKGLWILFNLHNDEHKCAGNCMKAIKLRAAFSREKKWEEKNVRVEQ